MQRIKQTLVILSSSINIPYMLIFLFLGCFLTPIQTFISKPYHAHATYTIGNYTITKLIEHPIYAGYSHYDN